VLTATYGSLLRTPGAAAFFLPAALGRVGLAMTSLGLVWLVHAHTGTFAAAGLVGGAFAVSDALVAPQVARVIDRFGQTRVLPPALLAHAAAVAVLVSLVAASASGALLILGGGLVGATVPQLAALSAARWAALLRPTRAAELPTAFALESLANAVAFLAGPALVSALGAAGHAGGGVALAALLSVGGGLALAAQHGTAPTPARGPAPAPAPGPALAPAPAAPVPARSSASARPAPGPAPTAPPPASAPAPVRPHRLTPRGAVLVLVGLNLALGVFFGAMQVSVTAFVVAYGVPGAAAPVFAVSSASGLLSGWLYGLRRPRAVLPTQLLCTTSVLLLGTVLLLTAGSPLALALTVALTGATIQPLLVLFALLTESTVPRAALTRAFSWLGSANSAGTALATTLAGLATDFLGPRGGFALAALAAAAMTLQSLVGLRLLRAPGGGAARAAGPG
jgi:hypothetical protein